MEETEVKTRGIPTSEKRKKNLHSAINSFQSSYLEDRQFYSFSLLPLLSNRTKCYTLGSVNQKAIEFAKVFGHFSSSICYMLLLMDGRVSILLTPLACQPGRCQILAVSASSQSSAGLGLHKLLTEVTESQFVYKQYTSHFLPVTLVRGRNHPNVLNFV